MNLMLVNVVLHI